MPEAEGVGKGERSEERGRIEGRELVFMVKEREFTTESTEGTEKGRRMKWGRGSREGGGRIKGK